MEDPNEQTPPVQPLPPQGQPQPPYGYPPQPSTFERIIPASNPSALIGYYLGLFSIMPVLGLGLGPAGIILGIKGIKAIKQRPGLPGMGHCITAIVGGIIGCLVNYGIATILLIAYFERPVPS